MHVVSPGRNFVPETFRVHDYIAYHRFVKRRLEVAVDSPDAMHPRWRPQRIQSLSIIVDADWWKKCDSERRADDHLSFVAGISRLQTSELRKRSINTLTTLAVTPVPLSPRPNRGALESYTKVREQARVQFESRVRTSPLYELLPLKDERGFARLPEPSSCGISSSILKATLLSSRTASNTSSVS